ncbi:GTPase [uncultured Aquimarina sp.]|uniref:GTPase n=1 Tax=uncultured Aquimarina sp. TaxID=575652 RepID=UPI0026348C9A|nr:GTPase [uncultured Aquimarina sp.]
MKRTIIFIYNADANIWNKYLDFAHKIISPSTYSCDLCSLTHGNFSENKIWKEFREIVSYEFVFKYKDEFIEEFNEVEYQKFQYPIILEEKDSRLDVLMNANELNLMNSVEDLIGALRKKLT